MHAWIDVHEASAAIEALKAVAAEYTAEKWSDATRVDLTLQGEDSKFEAMVCMHACVRVERICVFYCSSQCHL